MQAKLCPGCTRPMQRQKSEEGTRIWACGWCRYMALANAIMRRENSPDVKKYLEYERRR